jgi:hypothetical protein
MLKLSAKCRIPAFNAQVSRGIRVAVHVAAVKIYVPAVDAPRKKRKERQGETEETIEIDGFLSSTRLNANVLFGQVFFESHPIFS